VRKIAVAFQTQGVVASVPQGSTILEAALSAGVLINSHCAGSGTCGKCRIRLLSGPVSPVTQEEMLLLPQEQLRDGFRLACRCFPSDDVTAEVPESALVLQENFLEEGEVVQRPLQPNVRSLDLVLPRPSLTDQRSDYERLKAALTFHGIPPVAGLPLLRSLPDAVRSSSFQVRAVLAGNEVLELLPPERDDPPLDVARGGEPVEPLCGVAFDIGTTSVVGYLFDLTSGQRLAVTSTLNPQTKHGADVISRMDLASSDEGLELLQSEAVGCLNQLVEILVTSANISRHNIYEATVVGNPCMTHLLLGVRPTNIAVSPFIPAFTESVGISGGSIGLLLHPRARVHVLPAVAGYVGADIVAGVVATSLHQEGPPRLYIDIGTNGEVVLAAGGRLLACSTAAGPAFEGGEITFGMRAAAGAIDHVSINSDVECTTIDDSEPVGICGSGLIEAVAELVKKGLVSPSGQLLSAEFLSELPESLLSRLAAYNGQAGFILSPSRNGPIILTQGDIRQVQLAKGAIAAGAALLLETAGLKAEDLDAILLAGAFGSFITKDSTLTLGLLPKVPPERIHSVGNGAGSGACLALLSSKARHVADEVAKSIEYIELSSNLPFQEKFVEAMAFRGK